MNIKRRNIFLYAGVIFAVAFVIFICTSHISQKKSESLSRAEMAKMLSLAVYTKEELSNMKVEPFFDMEEGAKGLEYCYGAVNSGYMKPIHEAFSPGVAFSVDDAKVVLKKAGLKEDGFSFLNKSGDLSRKECFQLYDKVLETTGNPNGIKKASFYLYKNEDDVTCRTNVGKLDCVNTNINKFEPGIIKGYLFQDVLVALDKVDKKAQVTFSNAWVVAAGNQNVRLFADGEELNIPYESSGIQTKMVADVTVQNNKVKSIQTKEEKISGRVLSARNDQVEVEGYGILPFTEKSRIYKVYGSLAMEEAPQVLMEYPSADFILENGEIAAVLLNEEADHKNIRVLLNTTGYSGIFHKKVKCSCNVDMMVSYSDTKEAGITIPAGQTVTLKKKSKEFDNGRIILTPVSPEGVITISSFQRSYGSPTYHGSLEIGKCKEGITIVNNVPIEEYLYSVVPSEMPVSYGLEALKVQSICARSYAFCQLGNADYSQYGAQVEDSTKCQVYNNSAENEASIEAVKETTGQVLDCDNEVVLAYFFSTSCGITSDSTDVWFQNVDEKKECPKYLKGRVQGPNEESLDLSTEDAFRNFMTSDTYDTFEKEMPWYRWQVSESGEHIQSVLENKIGTLGDNLYVRQENGSYEKGTAYSVGKIQSVTITKRGTSGIAKEIEILGDTGGIKVTSEYAIRQILAPLFDSITQNDGNSISFSMLPSGYFYLDSVTDEKGNLVIEIHGGGYGHGVGMSQNGVKVMSEKGYTAEDMIHHFFSDTVIKNMY